MIIQSDFLTEGLFGQIFIWMLEILPYVDSQGWRPEWRIRSRNYGAPPEFNIFPSVLQTKYEAPNDEIVQSFERLNFHHKFHFKGDFQEAGRHWNSHFRFSEGVTARLDRFWEDTFEDETVLGVHYRGTDKNGDPYQTNPMSRYEFLAIIEDFLSTHPDVSAIFVASDDMRFIQAMRGFPKVGYYSQARAESGQPLWNDQRVIDKKSMAEDAILDSLSLSRCRYVLKSMSQLSAFCKVFNPGVEAYRVTACKRNWFPEAAIPLYQSESRPIRALLKILQEDDIGSPQLIKIARVHRRLGTIAQQAWKRRATLAQRARNAIFGR